MERSGIELLHGWTSPLSPSPTLKAQPYNEMEQSGIELLHGYAGKLILLFTIRRILPYDCFRHLHPVHCSRCDAACISRAFAARIDPGEA